MPSEPLFSPLRVFRDCQGPQSSHAAPRPLALSPAGERCPDQAPPACRTTAPAPQLPVTEKETGSWRGSDQHRLTELLGAFRGGLVVKNLPANVGNTGSIPGPGTNIPHAVGATEPATTPEPTTSLRQERPLR